MNGAARRLSSATPIVVGLVTMAVLLLGMEIAIQTDVLSRYTVPPPSEIVLSFERVVMEEGVFGRFLVTTMEALGAGLLLVVVGVPLGVLIFSVHTLRAATETWVAAFAAAPIVLGYPLFLVIFGRNASTIIAMGFVAGIAPVILKTLEGLSAIKPVLINVGRSYNISKWQQFWRIMLPASLPTIFVGIRLGLLFALINVVGVEFMINFGGLGPLINELAERYDLPGTWAAICFVVLVSIVFFVTLERIERWLRPTA